jgi:hypothetical protein
MGGLQVADYTVIPAADIADNAPGRERTYTRLRDNPIAIAEAATGAPRLANDAVANGAIGEAQLKPAISDERLVAAQVVASNVAGVLQILSSYNAVSLTETTEGHYTLTFLQEMPNAIYYHSGISGEFDFGVDPVAGYIALDHLIPATVAAVSFITLWDAFIFAGVADDVERFSFQVHGVTPV